MTDITLDERMRTHDIFVEQISEEPDYYPFCDFYIEAIQDTPWTHRLYTFASDVQDFKVKLTDQTRELIVRNLSMISQLEVSVKRFWAKSGDNLPHPNIINLGFVMAANEVVHGKAYKHLLKVLGIKNAFDEILKLDMIKNRVNYLNKHIRKFHADNKKQFIYSLILFTLIIENIALFSAFYTISWFNRVHDVLKDTNKQVQYTSREETIHANVGIALINEIRKEHPELFDQELEDKVLKEVEDSIKYEFEINKWSLNGFTGVGENGEALSPEHLQEMLKNRLNDSLIKIGYRKIFDIDQNLLEDTEWFDRQLIAPVHTDFFQERPAEYGNGAQGFEDDDLFDN
jgi:ribonucleoside-diphosphate reductase beta chain